MVFKFWILRKRRCQTRVMVSFLAVCLLLNTLMLYHLGQPSYINDIGPGKVLITAYPRSGSSFLGKILGWRNDTFYLYEPLWADGSTYFQDIEPVCSGYEPTCQMKHNSSMQSLHRALRYLQDIYRCNIARHYAKTNDFHARAIAAPSWSVFKNCMKTFKASKTACLEKESLVCKSKQNLVTKVVKMSLQSAKPLLSSIPELKIIHLLRDPRAIINSRVVTTSWYKRTLKTPEMVEKDIQELCSRMQSDIKVGKHLIKDFPGRVRFIQYEDFHDPVNKAAILYQYLGMKYTTESVYQFVQTMINPRPKKRQTEGFHPFSYRKTLSWKYVLLVNKYCSDVYKELGLVQFNTEADFKNEGISVIHGGLPFCLD